MVVEGVSMGALVVFALIAVALVLFVSELVSNDVTAIGVIVALAALEPWTQVTPVDAISGFANPATITIIAMYMLSAGVQGTGLVERLGVILARLTHGDERRVLAATVVTTGPIAGFINNTPVVAVFIPMISELARKSNVSPSKLLLPLSYAAILGGTLTLIGTSTNIIASDLTRELLDRGPIGFFEFTPVGIVILVVGAAYLFTVGWWLTPARIPTVADLTEEFALQEYLYQVELRDDSGLVGQRVSEIDEPEGVDLIHLERRGEAFSPSTTDLTFEPGDRLIMHGSYQAVEGYARQEGLRRQFGRTINESSFETEKRPSTLAKLIVPEHSTYVGRTVEECRLARRYETTVLSIARGTDRLIEDLDAVTIQAGDTLLVRSTDDALDYLHNRGDVIRVDAPNFDLLADDAEAATPISSRAPIAIGTMIGVVALAALGVVPIVIAALLGVFVMLVTETLTPSTAYDAVSWNVIFLLAGVIPLGIALEATGGAAAIADLVVRSNDLLPLNGVLLVFVLVTGVIASVITPVATVVLMIPIAVDAAGQLGTNRFTFLLGVMFASAISFMTPVGYQTNLMVYAPGGYRFTDFVRVGAPLQLLLSLVVTAGVAAMWGL